MARKPKEPQAKCDVCGRLMSSFRDLNILRHPETGDVKRVCAASCYSNLRKQGYEPR